MSTIAKGLPCVLGDGTIIRPRIDSEGSAYQAGIEIDGMFAKVPEALPDLNEAIEAAVNAFDHWSRNFGGNPVSLQKAGQ